MEGYSVTEAASVLGVPTERVWELLARGVLAGTPEGETGMRVFLQPRPAPAPPEARPNGNGGTREPERELSPFRELLTEFRNLTERYGQALLALGEARGEVAALRSRVDLLEARMDLRLPPGSGSPASGWPSPMSAILERGVPPPERPAPSESGATDVATEDAGGDEDVESRSTRRRTSRRATESFAEALARADDPSVPELPGGPAAAAVLAAMRDEAIEADQPVPEAALPRELPPAEPVPVAEEPDIREDRAGPEEAAEPEAERREFAEPAEAIEPEETAESAAEFEHAGGAEAAPRSEPDVAIESGATRVPEAAEAAEETAVDEPDAELELEPEPRAAAQPEAASASPDEPAEAAEPDAEPERAEGSDAAFEPTEPVAPAEETAGDGEEEAAPPSWDRDRYSTEIAEPDWYEAEVFPAEAAAEGPPPGEDAAAEEPPPGEDAAAEEPPPPGKGAAAEEPPAPSPTPATPAGGPAPAPSASVSRLRPPAPEVSDEETVLWFGRTRQSPAAEPAGDADEMEVAPTGHRPGEASVLPGSQELDDAFAALEALSRSAADQAHGPVAPGEAVRAEERDEPSASPPADAPRREARVGRPPAPTPASRAYRRLRRIFPG
jgi:hypothetical protein